MSFLTPLGLLGLIGLIVWLIIFIIKPNYQKKLISTTYVWMRSLKFRKKRLPTSRLRSILMIICQILAIISIATAMAQPFIAAPDEYVNEKIIILDASCDMLTTIEDGEENRFERAINQIIQMSDAVLDADGIVTVILADNNPSYVVKQAGKQQKEQVQQEVKLLMDANEYRCTYGTADMEAAMVMAESILQDNPKAEVVLYTGTIYTDAGKVTVVDVSDKDEWNCAILSANATSVDNFYEFSVDIAAYGRDTAIELYVDVYGANDDRGVRNFHESVVCTQEMGTVTVTFGNDQRRAVTEEHYILTDMEIYSYEYAYVHIEHNDSLPCDNTLYLYGGTQPVLKIQYYSTLPNPFYSAALRALRDTVSSQWEIQLTEVRDTPYTPAEPALEGFDVYIFEHTIPSILPTDGLVILSDPDSAPAGSGFYLGTSMKSSSEIFLTAGEAGNPIMSGINATNISLTKLTAITNYGADFVPLLYCETYPVLLASINPTNKMVVMPFSLNNSNLPLVKEFPTLLLNLLDYYVPSTLDGFLYEVNDNVKLHARSPKLDVEGPGVSVSFEAFPSTLYVTEPGVYTLSQTPISGKPVIESFYVKVPASESNIRSVVDTLENPETGEYFEALDQDLVYFVAMLLVALLFCEWLLQLKEYF